MQHSDWAEIEETVLRRISLRGAAYGDVRAIATTVETLAGHDRTIVLVQHADDAGFGVRVLCHGAWGFAASSVLTAAEACRIVDLAVALARDAASRPHTPVRIADEPPHIATVTTPRRVDPFSVPLGAKTELLEQLMERLHRQRGVVGSHAHLWAQKDQKRFGSTEGTRIGWNLLALQASFSATATFDGRFASRSFSTPQLRTGYELIENATLLTEASRIAAEAVEKVRADEVSDGTYDLVLDPKNLALTIHESCGHATELDRSLGYESNYAGTTFLTPDLLGSFRYGSPHVTLVADNTEPEALASTGYDDDGVACQRWDIVRDGVFVGYSTNREVAPLIEHSRSRGCSRADRWASIPLVRIANIGLAPGTATLADLIADVRRGIYIEGHDSFSIDQQRYNFQFGGDACWLIENGRRTGMLRNVIYHGVTPTFWGRCAGVADAAHRQRFGFISCGKGQPSQPGWMTHPASHALFRGVAVMQGRAI